MATIQEALNANNNNVRQFFIFLVSYGFLIIKIWYHDFCQRWDVNQRGSMIFNQYNRGTALKQMRIS